MESTQTTEEDTQLINKVLSYWFCPTFPPPDDLPFRNYWFHATPAQDDEMKSAFSPLWERAVEDDLLRLRWSSTRPGRMALLILLDQLPRNMFRGTAQMFASDSLACPLALQMANDDNLTPLEKMFIFISITHAESLECAKMAETGLTELVKSLMNQKIQKKYMKLLPSTKAHVSVLEQFGRYCHRNELLGRESTEEEKKFLLTAKNNFIKSVKPKSPAVKKERMYDLPVPIRPMKILLLHGFRQNATTIRDAMKPLISALRPYPIEFIILNSPMVYRPGTTPFGDSEITHPTWAQPADHLRCWWIASDDGGKEYVGWESSVRFIERAWVEKGGWDGVVAFSQGATLSWLLSAMSNLSCSRSRFAVLISGSPSRAVAHQIFQQNKIKGIKTQHIYGVQDHHLGTPEEMKERTLKLAATYEDAEIVEHGGGHFTPQWWPWDKIAKFLLAQSLPVEDFSDEDFGDEETKTVEDRLEKLIRYWERHGDSPHPMPPLYDPIFRKAIESFGFDKESIHANWMRNLVESIEQNRIQSTHVSDERLPEQLCDDWLVLSFFYYPKFCGKGNKDQGSGFRDLITFLGLMFPEYLIRRLPLIVKLGDWRDINNLIPDNYKWIDNPDHGKNSKLVHSTLIEFMGEQLRKDAAIVASQWNSASDEEGVAPDFTSLSLLAFYVPRIRSSLDTKTHFARDLALWLRPATNDKEKLTAYVGYQKLYRSICTVLQITSPDRASRGKDREVETMPRLTVDERNRILSMPPNLFVTMPEEVPVAPCPFEDLKPLINYLSLNPPLPKENVRFVRGVVLPVKMSTGSKGVLDLCKQVVGPEGISPLLNGLRSCKEVGGLLLGNNVTGSKGAREIAKYIRRHDSQITTWYLGGNQFGPDDIDVISSALANDSKVQALWLKRNPVLPAGTVHLAKMLAVNRTLTTLDLSNCGLLDEGCIALFKNGLMFNQALKHLYLNTNGITPAGARYISEYFLVIGQLESLYLSCNPLGDEGVEALSRCLKHKRLVRLGLASCGIGERGIGALVEVFATLNNLEYLNLGFLKGTYLFNGLPNYLGLDGMKRLCSVIPQMPSLRYLDINHNQIPPDGFQLLNETLHDLPDGTGLTSLLFGQFGQPRSELAEQQLKETLRRNRLLWGKQVVGGHDENEWRRMGEELADRVLCPDHVKEIISTTRNMD